MAQSLNQRFGTCDVKFSSQVRDMNLDHIGMMLPIEIVEMLQQFLLRNHRARPMNKIFKNSIFRWREIEELTATADSLLDCIQLQIRNRDYRSRNALGASYERFDSGQQFSQIERLVEIIVGSCIQQIYDGFFAFLRRKNKDGSVKFPSTQVFQNKLTALGREA